MFVVIEWNQASHRPSLVGIDVYDTEAEARDVALEEERRTLVCARRERFTVHELGEEVPR